MLNPLQGALSLRHVNAAVQGAAMPPPPPPPRAAPVNLVVPSAALPPDSSYSDGFSYPVVQGESFSRGVIGASV